MKKAITTMYLLMLMIAAQAQINGKINGTVRSSLTQEYLPGVTITALGSDTALTISDQNGNFEFTIAVGRYNLEITALGYESVYLYNINVNAGNAQVITIEMDQRNQALDVVVVGVSRSARATDMITPLATQKLTAEEIRVNPGGNFDVSKVIQVLPGVAGGTSANRNDIIVRGGGPAENVYYLDGIEIPVLNHFQTQGASGGATGILNVSFINDVQLTSSAFDSRYGNALASTFVIKQRNGNPDKLGGNMRLSGSEFAATLEGPLSQKTTFLASARRSYLKYLFEVLNLPIRPDYWDFQYKVNHKIDQNTELNLIGIGALDNFRLVAPKTSSAENEYILRSNPLIDQWNYTVGASLKKLMDNGYYTLALSRNMLSNGAKRYEDNVNESGEKLFDLRSHEIENKLRLDVNHFLDGWKFSYGGGVQYAKYDMDLNNVANPNLSINAQSQIDLFKMEAFAHLSRYFLEDRLLVSGGMRTDLNTFTGKGLNPLKTLSPRISASYELGNQWNISGSVGSYYKLPSYTALGYRENNGLLVNKNLAYINAIHYTLGTQFVPRNDFRFTLEAFYKDYNNYPVSITDGISMANIGVDFNAIGNEAYRSDGLGRVYGMEAYIQQKLIRNLFYVLSATVYKSEFSGTDGVFRPSTWDYGYVVSGTLGYKFGRNWDLGVKYRVAGGQPYTPFDMAASQSQYLASGRGVYDYSLLNSQTLSPFQQLDIRVDKKFNFRNTSLILFADFQNALLYKTPAQPKFTFQRKADNSGFETYDGLALRPDGSNAIPLILKDRSATIVPAVGFIFEF
ncbi:MAG TPA: TonB-dependent receptor [Sphingobacteriaceae bacterium]|nr:TonB-dependent receptor [Sphingobacteriaceae bacterium]